MATSTKFFRKALAWFITIVAVASIGRAEDGAASQVAADSVPRFTSRADRLPRKVMIASAVANFSGTVEQRLALAARLIDEAATTAKTIGTKRALDLVILPEFAFLDEAGTTAAERALELDGPVLSALCGHSRRHQTWIVVPMTLREAGNREKISNAAVLLNREGEVAGIFRKVHPMVDPDGRFEGGVAPGNEYPVFECDFGRLGILICWDMSYPNAWKALAVGGAELVALPSASPQTLRPAAEALRHHYYVATSTPRNNASIFDPIGRIVAQRTAPGVIVHEIDLAYAILHWTETLQEGRVLRERFGTRVGGDYSPREDTGVFWSNDPEVSIGEMIRELGLREMPLEIERVQAARDAAVPDDKPKMLR
jgi:predicted amidohydrolase